MSRAFSRLSLAASVVGEERRLISVISGFDTKKARSNDSIKVISWALRNTNTFKIAEKDLPSFKFKTWLGKDEIIDGHVREDIYLTVSKKDLRNLKVTLNYIGPLKAPIKKDQEIGKLTIE